MSIADRHGERQFADLADVSAALDEVVATARRDGSPIGFFAALYSRTTAAIHCAIEDGTFADGPRIERLALTFAGRYFDALDGWKAGHATTVSQAWAYAFDMATHRDLLTIEHILLGMDAHILLDLGVAAATISTSETLGSLRPDFDRVNNVLGSLIDPMRRAVSKVERWLTPFEAFGHIEDLVADEGVKLARSTAWDVATYVVAAGDPTEQQARVATVDQDVGRFSAHLVTPTGVFGGLLRRLARLIDDDDVDDIIDALLATT